MDGTATRRHAHDWALQLPGAELTHPFGEDWDVYKVRGKVFMLQTSIRGELVTVKAAPMDAEALCEQLTEITPGYHMNKRHWVTIHAGDAVTPELVEDLVTESYLLVVAGLPRAARPVDPESFGRDE